MNKRSLLSPRGAGILAVVGLGVLFATDARAGDVYLTGHDVLLHSGQRGYDALILDFLRGGTAKGDYHVGVVGTVNTGIGRFTNDVTNNIPFVGHGNAIPVSAGSTIDGYSSATFYDAETLAADPARATVMAGLDVLVVLSHTSCGGCSLTTAGSNALNSMAADIATAFNDGMDIWANAGSSLATYYDFLPPGAVASGSGITGSIGFSATPEGSALGIANNMINGFPTHNRFTDFPSAFTVFELHSNTDAGGNNWIISLGLKDGRIEEGEITIDPPTPGIPGVPDTGATLLLLGLVLPCMEVIRRFVH